MVGCSIDDVLEVVDVAMRLVEANNHVMFKSAVPDLLTARGWELSLKWCRGKTILLSWEFLFTTVRFGNFFSEGSYI